MKIVADENIALLDKFFSQLGEITRVSGRQLTADQVRDADVLLVRSVTPVNEALLAGSSVRFVGTATIGLDHLDTVYLDAQGIKYANAPGCNANSVVEYVFSVLTLLAEYDQFRIQDKTVGIIGYGNVGKALAVRLKKFGVNVLINDPPLQDEGAQGLCSLEEVLQADILTLHVPLTEDGDHPTHHLFDEARLASLANHQYLINTSRGSVIDNQALVGKLKATPDFRVVLDVWENEPAINPELLDRVILGTPHIAGYSLDGKAIGSEMVYRELCQFLGFPARHKAGQFLPEPPLTKLGFSSAADETWALSTAIRASYDVRVDNWKLKSKKNLATETLAQHFDHMRKHYPARREFCNIKIQLKNVEAGLLHKFNALGFKIIS